MPYLDPRAATLAQALHTFFVNSEELLAVLVDLRSPGSFLPLFNDPFKLEEAHSEVARLLHNWVSAALSLADQSRRVIEQHDFLEGPLLGEYKKRKDRDFTDSPLHRFIQSLRAYCLHYDVPDATAFLAARLQDGDTVESSCGFRLDSKRLLEWKKWSAEAKDFLLQHPDGIDLVTLVQSYVEKVRDLHEWLWVSQREEALARVAAKIGGSADTTSRRGPTAASGQRLAAQDEGGTMAEAASAGTPEEPGGARSDEAAARYCDIVMKGGISSGIAYPLAIDELRKVYRFKNIGGTSAGAIAAAAAAAAEHGRYSGRPESFDELAALPATLGQPGPDGTGSRLFSLFQPQPGTRRFFNVLVAGLGPSRGRSWRVARAAARAFPGGAILGALPGLLVTGLHVALLRSWSSFPGAAAGLGVAVVGALAGMLWSAKRSLDAIPENGYGLCSGYAEPSGAHPAPLTAWLDELLNRLAGKQPGDGPLTFGDLWGTRDPEVEHRVNLAMMTTNLTHGLPYRLPFSTDIFYFSPEELRGYFPKEVVDWMEQHPRRRSEALPRGLAPMPAAADLPVVVAARLSLSFPLLMSAVPLYAVDYSREVPDEASRAPERCWFSDGGICSNFPVHFFDQPLPRWPTFAVNLRPFHPDDAAHEHEITMPDDNLGGIQVWWTRLEGTQPWQRVISFLWSIVDAMQSWRDNAQLPLPGYRDRVVTISLDPESEGGLNLDMPGEVITRVSNRGRLAGAELVRRFTAPAGAETMSWDNHRWVRYRSTMALAESTLASLATAYRAQAAGGQSYAHLASRSETDPPASYRWESKQHAQLSRKRVDELIRLADGWEKKAPLLQVGAPRPAATWRIAPEL